MVIRRRAIGALAGCALIAATGPALAEGFWDSVVGAFKGGPTAQPPAAPAANPGAKPAAAQRRPAAAPPAAAGAEAPKPAQAAEKPDPRKPAQAATKPPAAKPGQTSEASASPPEPAKKTPAASVAAAAATTASIGAGAEKGFIGQRAALDRANAYFNGISTLVADFTQIGADGRKVGGRLHLVRPGRLRFDYDEPSTLEIVADGSAVAVREKKLGTQDLYWVKDTPLKFLLRENTDLQRDVTLKEIAPDPQGVRIVLEDGSTLGGTSRITLFFDPEVKKLSQWRIIDPQGYETTVVLSNLERGKQVDAGLFAIKY
jgi:outer membrane lipoprotein-sorting protein